LKTQIQELGESHSYNSGTHDLLWCLDSYANGLRWKRQFEKGDVLDKAALRAKVEQQFGKVNEWDYSRYEPDLARIDEPEVAGKSEMQRCVEECGALAGGKSFDQPMPRDVELAGRYGALCKAELVQADVAVAARDDRKTAASAAKDLDSAEKNAKQGRY